ncbi:Glycosyl transferase 2 family protein [Paenibacillus sp. P22]|nr:Glycosyl transferase 2 family protein [Paenibacillus sp. P22]
MRERGRKMKTSIIILTHNQLEYTVRCLASIISHTKDYELVLVDNGSTDGTPEMIRRLGCKAVFNAVNAGFAKGCNQGLELADGEFVLFLNNDTVVTEGWLEAMLRALESDRTAGMTGPVSNYVSGQQQVEADYGPGLEGLGAYAAARSAAWQGKIIEVPRLVGFCLLLPRDLALEMGGFDERFGLGNYEDDDLCMRIRSRGYRLVVACDSFIHHYGHVTINALEDFDLTALLSVNREIARRKWGEDLIDLIYKVQPTLTLCVGADPDAGQEQMERTLDSMAGLADEIMLVHYGGRDSRESVHRTGLIRNLKTVYAEAEGEQGAEANGVAAGLREAGRDFILWLRAGEELQRDDALAFRSFRRGLSADVPLISFSSLGSSQPVRMALCTDGLHWDSAAGFSLPSGEWPHELDIRVGGSAWASP